MSLFKNRTFWSTNCDEGDENFDQNSLLITKLNSDSDYIITGSHNSILRIYKPSAGQLDSNDPVCYKVTDLLIEKIVNQPILQIQCGRLVSGSQKRQLAVLHSRSLVVYSFAIKEGATDHGTQHIIQQLYEHKLRRAAASFILGPFGGSQNRDFLCVQSLDGMLTFYEQESFSFCCFLPDFLLPSPLVYVRKTDSFVTCNSNWYLTSYKYKLLSEAGQNSAEEDCSGRKIVYDWNLNLGESIIDMQIIDEPDVKENSIMILGERNYFCISDTGRLKYMKKLEYSPICFANYILHEKIMSLIVAETNTLLIYQNTTLKWSAQLEFSPIALDRAILEHVVGALVFLSENGRLECCYLGTHPSLFVAPPLVSQPLDFDKAGIELATLNRTIRNSYHKKADIASISVERELVITITPNPHLDTCTFQNNMKVAFNNQMCTVKIDILPQIVFEQVQMAFFVQRPLKVVPQVKFFDNLTEKTSIECYVYVDEAQQVPSLNFQLIATFITNLGVPKTIIKSTSLPLSLVVENCTPQKEAEFKITLNLNQTPIGLSELFPEFAGQNNLSTSSNAIGFKNVIEDGQIVTILLAKSSERYRLQSDSLASLSLLIEQMIIRLKQKFPNRSDFRLYYNSPLPIVEILKYVNQHFEARKRFNLLQEDLMQLSGQFRLIQKRLIAKFKIKNPTPLSNLEMLLDDTFGEIMKITEHLDQATENLNKSQIELSCILHLINNLIKTMDIDENIKSIMESLFSTVVYDVDKQNWEDVLDASLCFLLRTILAKSDKDKLRAAHTSFDEIKDIGKVEKHITQVLERIPKGNFEETHFSIEEETETNDDDDDDNDGSGDVYDDKKQEIVPIGSRIGEASVRVLSAKGGLLRRRRKIVNNN